MAINVIGWLWSVGWAMRCIALCNELYSVLTKTYANVLYYAHNGTESDTERYGGYYVWYMCTCHRNIRATQKINAQRTAQSCARDNEQKSEQFVHWLIESAYNLVTSDDVLSCKSLINRYFKQAQREGNQGSDVAKYLYNHFIENSYFIPRI